MTPKREPEARTRDEQSTRREHAADARVSGGEAANLACRRGHSPCRTAPMQPVGMEGRLALLVVVFNAFAGR
jgi:hypothetical protein